MFMKKEWKIMQQILLKLINPVLFLSKWLTRESRARELAKKYFDETLAEGNEKQIERLQNIIDNLNREILNQRRKFLEERQRRNRERIRCFY